MDSALYDLLRKNNDYNSTKYSHCTNYGPAQKWSISDSKYDDFWLGYCDLVKSDHGLEKKLCLAEIPIEYMPVIVDFNLKFLPIESGKHFDDDFLLSVIWCYQQVLKSTLKISESEIELYCCYLEAESFTEDGLTHYRFRLQFPYCKTLASIQNRLIRPMVLQMFRNKNIMKRMVSQPVNDWEDIVDPLSVEKPITLYGSSTDPINPKLDFQFIFGVVNEEDIETNHTQFYEIGQIFNPVNHEHAQNGLISTEIFEKGDDSHDYWLPLYLSIYYYKVITPAIQSPPTELKTSVKGLYKSRSSDFSDEDIEGPEYLSNTFLAMLSRDRVEEDHFWLDVGKSLYGAFEGSERGLEKWIEFTESSDNHTPEECKSLYSTFQDSHMTIKTLAWYAREDSPHEYEKWHKNWYLKDLEVATSCLDSDVAHAVYKIYWLEFACGNLKKGQLYHFKNHIWKQTDDLHVLRSYISKDFLKIMEKFRTEVAIQIQDSNDPHFKDSAEILIGKIGKLINKLKTRVFKHKIVLETCEKFYVEDFNKFLDGNENLMGLVNGVVETLDTKAIVREGKPEDYVSLTTGLFWRHDLHEKHPLVIRLMDWLCKVFPDKRLLDYFGKSAASCLRGKNSDKKFTTHSGQGDNSKSMIKKLFEAVFGAYCITFPTSIFTSKKSSGGPDPAIARSKYARIAFVQEPDPDTPMKTGTIKEMTGGDRFFARFLNDNGGEIEPMFKLHLQCNGIPIFPNCDKAIKNRMIILPYLSTWVDYPPKTMDERFRQRKFQKDKFFENQIPELAPAFMWYLVKTYTLYRKEGLSEPDIVKKTTSEYWEDNDIYTQFIRENIEKAFKDIPDWPEGKKKPLDEKSFLVLSEIYSRFRDWFRENYGNLKLPDRQILKQELTTRLTKPHRNKFYGLKFKLDLNETAFM